MAAAPALSTASSLLSPPSDEETLLYTPPTPHHAAINTAILTHPLTLSLLADARYSASRPHLKIPPHHRPHNLTAGTLLGSPDTIAVPPLAFATADGSAYVSLQHLGPALCGHPGLVHGGLLATLLDEGLARCCFPALPHRVGVTASLKVDYRRPCEAGQVVVLRAETVRVEGRKAWVRGWLETLVDERVGETPLVLVEAEALFTMARVYA
ncbi:Thioesterase/thiol ester dehydrase-isomerase [Glonium stellatum]|uniref:Thioesterase/thiol ester dehydrase-isomerase n=1 Tax=Glonium stellatum TaxID=574774 RepID=A0A8E2JLI3_9PEZI|nr:Thioesterase/thiol ester dehydrase-isomerase [Glonium stellatum]